MKSHRNAKPKNWVMDHTLLQKYRAFVPRISINISLHTTSQELQNCIFIQLAPLLGYNKYNFVFIK